jgi:hypothetical protein
MNRVRAVALAMCCAAAACASREPSTAPPPRHEEPTTTPMANDPRWHGPALSLRHLGDGGVELELTAPTAGHRFDVHSVARRGDRVDVVCGHHLPTGDFVAQVITPLRVVVPAADLGDARVVAVHVVAPDSRDGGQALAIVASRPARGPPEVRVVPLPRRRQRPAAATFARKRSCQW